MRRFVTDNKCSVEFDPFGFCVKDLKTPMKLLRCNSDGPLYTITPPVPPAQAFSVSTPTGTLWHRCLGHTSSSTLQSLSSLGFISTTKTDLTTLCHACQLGKHVRLPFYDSTTFVSKPFDLIHSDLWTSPVASISGIKYYLIFLDDYSHYVWVYPLQRKSDVFSRYLHFTAMVQAQFHRGITFLQCDNGREYDNRQFRDHFATTGTSFRFSCPYTSQQNGKAERMLRTLNNSLRTLLNQAHMPPSYWVEALHTAAHTINLLPSAAINNEIPFTRLYNKVPRYDHLRVFGSLCYPNLLPTFQHKLAPRSTACVFLGYPSDHRGFRCLDISTKKIILSRHVVFDENAFPFANMPNPAPPEEIIVPTPPIPRLSPLPAHPQPIPIAPPTVPPPTQTTTTHPMQTRSKSGIVKPVTRLCLHTTKVSPLPSNHIQAATDPNWNPAMREEYNALIKTGTWSLVPRPKFANIIRSMWLYRHKFDSTGRLARYKARLVANGKSQQQGIDCDETFSPVVKPATIRAVLHVATVKNWPLRQLDVKNAFLHGDLKETVYMHQPPGFKNPTKPNHVCLLRRSLYGLKQAPRAWYTRFSIFATKFGFIQSILDPSLFVLPRGRDIAYLLLYVDDIALTASSPALLDEVISALNSTFAMTDLGPLHHFLGISIIRNAQGTFLHQQNYAADILHRANMTSCNPCLTPVDTKPKLAEIDSDSPPVKDPTLYRSLAGALQYLTFTRPDISYAVQQVCLFMHDPREDHFNALKRILRYVKGTITHGLQLHRSSPTAMVAYSDADWAGCPSTRRSTSGYCVFLGNNLISWSSKRQQTVSRSSAEAEYKGVANAVAELTWLRNLFTEMRLPIPRTSVVFCDNVSAVYLSTNPVQHQRTKHVEIDIHFVREKVALGYIRVVHVPSSLQYADIFTKGLPTILFQDFRSSLSIRQPPAPTAGGC